VAGARDLARGPRRADAPGSLGRPPRLGASGAITSGLGYAVWYAALGGLTATRAAIVQLAAPPLAALGGVVLLGESLSLRLLVASGLILGGIGLAVAARRA
jgi:drug/metabolite transporter (DMT)-like permease